MLASECAPLHVSVHGSAYAGFFSSEGLSSEMQYGETRMTL